MTKLILRLERLTDAAANGSAPALEQHGQKLLFTDQRDVPPIPW